MPPNKPNKKPQSKFDPKKFVFHNITMDEKSAKRCKDALSDADAVDQLWTFLDGTLQDKDETKVSLRWDDGGFYLATLIRHNSAITARAGSSTEALLLVTYKLCVYLSGVWPDAGLMHESVWG